MYLLHQHVPFLLSLLVNLEAPFLQLVRVFPSLLVVQSILLHQRDLVLPLIPVFLHFLVNPFLLVVQVHLLPQFRLEFLLGQLFQIVQEVHVPLVDHQYQVNLTNLVFLADLLHQLDHVDHVHLVSQVTLAGHHCQLFQPVPSHLYRLVGPFVLWDLGVLFRRLLPDFLVCLFLLLVLLVLVIQTNQLAQLHLSDRKSVV